MTSLSMRPRLEGTRSAALERGAAQLTEPVDALVDQVVGDSAEGQPELVLPSAFRVERRAGDERHAFGHGAAGELAGVDPLRQRDPREEPATGPRPGHALEGH